ncbi:hypothetical protein [Aminobacter aminovorans]|uniref:Uncharacterized protein n=1 Tax=Aminobacter aminovorans TaxID=83263 RepID=A0AAC8YMQ2_AMIAI|nr:hypothetical protein [Aminobacter aminovorans]AMS41182.1 hypothetical protein AA2016_2254 [Aminobacter aminovorans]MBB3705835.1 hypothetical protein [Aminobacter aminovorans]
MSEKAKFRSEAELCATFISQLPEGWTAYPETAGFDILLSRDADGAQVGIEAKLVLNAKVIEQAVPHDNWWHADGEQPDFRAALVPWGCAGGLSGVCGLLGITVIQMASKELYQSWYEGSRRKMRPELPKVGMSTWEERDWRDWCPAKRCTLPDYIPDVTAGASAPVQLSDWKIRAIKLVVLLDRRGYVTRADFKHLQLDPGRWIYSGRWLVHGAVKGQFVRCNETPDFRTQHPVNFEQIAADFEKWSPVQIRADHLATPEHQERML